jgi:predicted nucleic acid-binding protein
MTLFGAHDGLDFRNAVLIATALNRGIDAIVSPDRDFEEVGGLERIDPADVEERLIE